MDLLKSLILIVLVLTNLLSKSNSSVFRQTAPTSPVGQDTSIRQHESVNFNILGNYEMVRYQPRHVHISYGNDPTEMFVTWSTIDSTGSSLPTVEYGKRGIGEHLVTGTSQKFTDAGQMNLTQYIHRVTLNGLQTGQMYVYHCGSDAGWSDLFFFNTMTNGSDWSPKFAIFGDMGNVNAKSLTRIQREVHMNMYDAIIHVGDFAYDMDSDNGLVGDSFMDQIQSVAAFTPYMTCPGNHEMRNNFLHYKNRFTMPGNSESMYYSFNIGPIHFIALNTECYYYLQYGIQPLIQQWEWLVQDLEEANKPENRAERPWIITFGHRPMYCSNADNDDCTNDETLIRVGIPLVRWFGMEELFMKHGVDLTIWAHEHSYERLWPIYNRKVYNGSYEEPYRNPKSLTHIITGSAGCFEIHDHFKPTKPEWSAFRSLDYGYSRLWPINKTHLYFEQVSDDQNGKIIDSFTLIRDKHEPYNFRPSEE